MTRDGAVVGLERGLEDQRVGRGSGARCARIVTGGRDRASGRARGSPSSAAKQAPESNRGQQSQSIDPSRDTSAAVSQSPMSA